jgi:hypothetical protein
MVVDRELPFVFILFYFMVRDFMGVSFLSREATIQVNYPLHYYLTPHIKISGSLKLFSCFFLKSLLRNKTPIKWREKK